MKHRVARVLVVLALLASAIGGLVAVKPAAVTAAGTTSLHIVKYAADGVTVENQTTIDVATMEATLPVQGDGTTHYYTEGPTFDPDNLWDPDEECPQIPGADEDCLKDKGRLKGTDLKDLCNLVGGAAHGDTIEVRATDGYGGNFDYENVYTPVPRQGPMVICWWKDGQYTGTWTDGMLMAFFTTVPRASDGKLIFGHQDMHDCLPEANWHWYYASGIQYPSTHGLYTKYVSEITIWSGGTTGWSVDVVGHLSDTVPQDWFENAIACHHQGATYTDGSDNWTGMPLWYLCGLVDDGNIHGPSAFNDQVAAANYTVKVIGSDNYTLSSSTVARNDNIVLANTLNGAALPTEQYPLRLVGSDVPGGLGISGITSIELLNLPPVISASATGSGGSISPDGSVVLNTGESAAFSITANAGYHIVDVKVDGASVGAVTSYTFTNVTGYHTIVASFAPDTHTITATAGTGGAISPSGAVTVNHGSSQTFVVTASPGYRTSDVQVDGFSVGVVSSYAFTSVTAGHTIAASFLATWDLNDDHTCDIGDVVMVGLHWGETGAAGWIPEDVSPSGEIDIGDVVVIGLYWGQIY
jgi:DMSO/TMAO reductase YedYZ molybdopterin-dependent catalytic subunit